MVPLRTTASVRGIDATYGVQDTTHTRFGQITVKLVRIARISQNVFPFPSRSSRCWGGSMEGSAGAVAAPRQTRTSCTEHSWMIQVLLLLWRRKDIHSSCTCVMCLHKFECIVLFSFKWWGRVVIGHTTKRARTWYYSGFSVLRASIFHTLPVGYKASSLALPSPRCVLFASTDRGSSRATMG